MYPKYINLVFIKIRIDFGLFREHYLKCTLYYIYFIILLYKTRKISLCLQAYHNPLNFNNSELIHF